MNIVSVEKDKDTRVVSFDETGKILSVSSLEPENDNLLFAYFKLTDIVPFMTGDKKLSDYLVSKTKDVFKYELIKTRVNIQKRSKESQLHHISEVADADIDITYDGKQFIFTPSKELTNCIIFSLFYITVSKVCIKRLFSGGQRC